MRVKKSTSLVFFENPTGFVAYNFITKDEFECDVHAVETIRRFPNWVRRTDAARHIKDIYGDQSEEMIDCLLSLNGLVAKDSEVAKQEREFAKEWEWNVPSAMLHFAVTDRDYMSVQAVEKLQQEKKNKVGTIDLYQRNEANDVVSLSPPDCSIEPFATMARRRSYRETRRHAVSLDAVSECLYLSLGITDWTENCVNRLPLKMTPSGGARNPFEAYVAAYDVDGLEKGFYHYSALQHSLQSCATELDVNPPELMGGQEWAKNASAIIFLCADFRRTMWKYDNDDNAYRVVLIEAGHIGQNIMLAATHNGYSACPCGAINHRIVHEKLGIDRITKSAIYALALTKMPEN